MNLYKSELCFGKNVVEKDKEMIANFMNVKQVEP